jgi:hypothetical protein
MNSKQQITAAELRDRILRRVSQTVAGHPGCPPAIADKIWQRIIQEELIKSK